MIAVWEKGSYKLNANAQTENSIVSGYGKGLGSVSKTSQRPLITQSNVVFKLCPYSCSTVGKHTLTDAEEELPPQNLLLIVSHPGRYTSKGGHALSIPRIFSMRPCPKQSETKVASAKLYSCACHETSDDLVDGMRLDRIQGAHPILKSSAFPRLYTLR